jgi:L-lactate dehydrogenase complex protein LldG
VVGETVSGARAEILARIRAADRGAAGPLPRAYRRSGTLGGAERIDRFCERVADYRADVRRVDDVARAVARVCGELSARRLVVPAGLPAAWRPNGLELVEDEGLAPRELEGLDGVLTCATVAIAETGTIVLSSGPREGRRAITLVPDLHVCLVEESQIVELVPEALERVPARRPLTFVSGPSATSDIELSRVEGVHGPWTLVVLVAPG